MQHEDLCRSKINPKKSTFHLKRHTWRQDNQQHKTIVGFNDFPADKQKKTVHLMTPHLWEEAAVKENFVTPGHEMHRFVWEAVIIGVNGMHV